MPLVHVLQSNPYWPLLCALTVNPLSCGNIALVPVYVMLSLPSGIIHCPSYWWKRPFVFALPISASVLVRLPVHNQPMALIALSFKLNYYNLHHQQYLQLGQTTCLFTTVPFAVSWYKICACVSVSSWVPLVNVLARPVSCNDNCNECFFQYSYYYLLVLLGYMTSSIGLLTLLPAPATNISALPLCSH